MIEGKLLLKRIPSGPTGGGSNKVRHEEMPDEVPQSPDPDPEEE